ncbi:hypothetical protein B0H15DRAFT_580055 [Mycena belliarum]|uniref:Uncharacterized protein n=1 Tax=Mycena belliarum TaxID=1033014 RepID=A0AAD6UEH3_9AGAR|nr:hypothetical protein B0H15DRAFT_580055 [Mycena belliae]
MTTEIIYTVDAPKPTPDRQIHFPPFPPVPDGVQITAFKDFQEWGTRVVGEDGIERDGLGIATIRLPSKNPKKKKKKGKGATAKPALKKEWWEDWRMSGEHERVRGPYDLTLDREDRLFQAAGEFEKAYEIHLFFQGFWDIFRNFIGVSTTTIFKTSNPQGDEAMSDDDSDDEGGEPAFLDQTASGAVIEEVSLDTTDIPPPKARLSKADLFCNDPARALAIFLSSHMRAQGQAWDRRKLVGAPHLVRFFVQFLIRNVVLPEHDDALTHALEVVDRAGDELPRIPDIAEALPDAFSVACSAFWGRKADGLGVELGEDGDGDEEDKMTGGERYAKRPRLDSLGEAVMKEADKPAAQTETADVPPVTAQDSDTEMPAPAEVEEGGWGEAAWGSDGQSGGWGAGSWATQEPLPPSAPPARPTLMALLGPTALPLTHAPGVVEWSVRKVVALLPLQTTSFSPPTDGSSMAVAAIEHSLRSTLHCAVLAPYPTWDLDPTLTRPRILRSSDRPAAKAHDVAKDEITVLLKEEAAGLLTVGMGLGGTWVQLAKAEEGEDKKEKGTYWYADELTMILPSFWTV